MAFNLYPESYQSSYHECPVVKQDLTEVDNLSVSERH